MKILLAVLAGLIAGSIVNMALIVIGPQLIPLPGGIDPTDPDSLAANIHLFETRHFLTPWLAHALGTLVGAVVAVKVSGRSVLAYAIGAVFLLGGVMMVMDVDSPMWFDVADLLGAYLPMAWLATRLTGQADEPA